MAIDGHPLKSFDDFFLMSSYYSLKFMIFEILALDLDAFGLCLHEFFRFRP